MRCLKHLSVALAFTLITFIAAGVHAKESTVMTVFANHAELITIPSGANSIDVENSAIADVVEHQSGNISVVGNKVGETIIRFSKNNGQIVKHINVQVLPDVPAIKRSLRTFLPDETIGVEVINGSIALTGRISGTDVADKALLIAKEFTKNTPEGTTINLINLMKIQSAQQVMLRVRVGEIQRTALKQLGFNLQGTRAAGNVTGTFSTGGGIGNNFGSFTSGNNIFGLGGIVYNSTNLDLAGSLDLLEQDGVFKLLAEPNLVAISGETADFLAGGEFPVPVAQDGDTISVDYKTFGVQVEFTPLVLSQNRIRLTVEPEVSELSQEGNVNVASFSIPSIATRRAKTTVELAPGESFMIAGLIKDDMENLINEVPGLAEIPILSALFRSTSFQRNETELVIAVTPYLVDAAAGTDIRLPTDNFHTPSVLESFFFGALSSSVDDKKGVSGIEGPVGFIVK